MPQIVENTKIRCIVEGDESLVYLKIDLLDTLNSVITTLEYSDITKEFNDFLIVNEEVKLYDTIEDIKKDLAQAKLNRFINNSKGSDKIEQIVELVSKAKHQSGECKNDCIYCNPDLGTDPFPDFNFNVRNSEPEGNA